MDRKARLVPARVMSSVKVYMVTLLVAFLNLGLRPDFRLRWVNACLMNWPVAATTAFVIMPPARRIAERIMSMTERKT